MGISEFDVSPLLTPTESRAIRYYRRLTRNAPTVFEIGIATIAAGERLPAVGTVALPADAFGFCIRGRFVGGPELAPKMVSGGTMCHLPAGVSQFGQYLEDSTIVYAYFGEPVHEPCVPNRSAMPWTSEIEYRQGGVSIPPRPGLIGRAFKAAPAMLDVGVARFNKGDKIPGCGVVALPAFNAEVLLQGQVIAHLNGKRYELSAGDVVMSPPHTERVLEFVEDSELIVMFFGEPVPTMDAAVLVSG